MTAARYWRAVGIAAHAAASISICALHLRGPAGRVDQSATLSASVVPVGGSVEDLTLGGITPVEFEVTSGLALTWDFGAVLDLDVVGIAVRASTVADKFIARVTLQYSGDGQSWTTLVTRERYKWPGGLGWSIDEVAINDPKVALLMSFETGITDISVDARAVSKVGGVNTTSGRNGLCASFDGATGYLYTPASDRLDLKNADFTVEMWVNLRAEGEGRMQSLAVICDALGSTVLGLVIEGNGTAAYTLQASAYATARSDGVVPKGRWVHIAGVRQGEDSRLYIDGVLQQSVKVAGPLVSANSAFTMGRFGNWSDGRFLYGSLDDVRVTIGLARYSANFVPIDIFAANLESPPLVGWRADRPIMLGEAVQSNTRVVTTKVSQCIDLQDGGNGRIYGTVARKEAPANVPLRRRVCLFEQVSKRFIRETWSQQDGTYEFTQIKVGPEYCVIAFDHEHNFRAVIADGITPEIIL